MSTEDTEARAEALTYLDAHTPMALEVVTQTVKPRRVRLDQRARSSKAGYAKALKLAAAERRTAARAQAKLDTAARRARRSWTPSRRS